MNVEKKSIAELNLCYAIGQIKSGDEHSFLLQLKGECQRFDLEEIISDSLDEPGGS